MSRALKSISVLTIIAAITVAAGLGFASRFAPELYSGFKQGVMQTAIAERMEGMLSRIPSMPPLLTGNTGAALTPGGNQAPPEPEPPDLTREEEMRGVWIATVAGIDFPKTQGNAEQQKQEIINILNTAKEAGLNTVFFQVRPHGDAFYPSDIFPWSRYLTGTAGVDPGYDPLAFVLEEADKRGLRVHAWINPYRLTTGSKEKPENTNASLPEGSPVKNRPDLTMGCGDGKLYLNPGEPEAMQLVADGVKELIEKYNVDGVHFDDYFYPSDASYDDSAAYEKYGKPTGIPLADWRRQNTTALVRLVKETIEASRPGVEFGISPSGIWANKSGTPLGSDTNGFEHYNRIYADSRLWIKDELVDYIVPQIYWAVGTEGSDYDVLVRWWRDVCLGTEVKLYIGHAAYRVGNEGAWSRPVEIGGQISLNRSLGAIDGSVFYGYSKIAENALGLRDQLKELFIDMELAQPLNIAYPASGTTSAAANSYIIGSADPRYPLYMNGNAVERTVSGYFSVYVPLASGENKFVFSYRGADLEYILNSSRAPGGSGSGGSAGSGSGGSGSGGGSGPAVTQLEKPLVYRTKEGLTVVRSQASANSVRMQPLHQGVKGYVVAESNGYYLMDSGNWTYKPNVEILEDESLPQSVAEAAVYTPGPDTVELSFKVPYFTSYYVDVTDAEVVLTLHQTQGLPVVRPGANAAGAIGAVNAANAATAADALFGEISFRQEEGHAVYRLPLQKAGRLYGYTINYDEAGKLLTFRFNNPPFLTPGDKPLAGKVIVVDAGHGGTDNGAMGPAGNLGKREKEVNLVAAYALERVLTEAGAEVIMTRTSDTAVALETRTDLIRERKPDLSVSLHRNSMGADKDISSYRGALVLYTHQQSVSLAGYISEALAKGTVHENDGFRWQSLAVCRIEECPAVLLELGFISNPADYERMNRISAINKEAEAVLRGIVAYLAGC